MNQYKIIYMNQLQVIYNNTNSLQFETWCNTPILILTNKQYYTLCKLNTN